MKSITEFKFSKDWVHPDTKRVLRKKGQVITIDKEKGEKWEQEGLGNMGKTRKNGQFVVAKKKK